MLINTVLIQALKAVQFHHIVMSEQLLKFLVLVTEHAHATKLTVFTIVEGPALGGSVTIVILLTHGLFRLFSRMLVRTVQAESARAIFHPVEARLSLWCLSRLLIM